MDKTKLNIRAANSLLPFDPGIRLLASEDIKDLITPHFNLSDTVVLQPPIVPVLGHMSLEEMAVLTGLIKAISPKHILELGTFDGLTGLHFLLNTPAINRLVTVDLPTELLIQAGGGLALNMDAINAEMIGATEIGKQLKSSTYFNKVSMLAKDTALLTKEELLKELPEEVQGYDAILVDAAHTYAYCKNDSELALSVAKPGALIIWHDYNKVKYLPGVTQYLLELAQERELYWLQSEEFDTSLVLTLK